MFTELLNARFYKRFFQIQERCRPHRPPKLARSSEKIRRSSRGISEGRLEIGLKNLKSANRGPSSVSGFLCFVVS